MKFVFTFTKPEDGSTVKFEGGRTSLWDAQEIAAEWPKRPTNQNRLDFAWAYCAAKRAGKLNELDVEGMGAEEAIDSIADTYDVEIKDNKPEADAPLADAPSE